MNSSRLALLGAAWSQKCFAVIFKKKNSAFNFELAKTDKTDARCLIKKWKLSIWKKTLKELELNYFIVQGRQAHRFLFYENPNYSEMNLLNFLPKTH